MKKRKTTALYALFLGGLGVHKFYLGEVGKGVLYLIFSMTFVPAIVSFFEGLSLLNMSDEEFNNKYNNPENLNNNNSGSFQRPNKFDDLKKLGELKSQGIVSDEEFEIEKNKILGNK